MSRRKPLVAANWKMNPPPEGWSTTDSPYRPQHDIDVLVFPPSLFVMHCLWEKLLVGAQSARPEPSGAFTGDIGMQMLKDLGCTSVLCGHSERRQGHGESDDFVGAQVEAAITAGLHPIACIGETLVERESGNAQSVVQRQLNAILPKLSILHSQFSIAYEPVWAIGTGKTATPAQAQDMHAFIRSLLPESLQHSTRILYGGSIKPENAAELFAEPDIDGGLVGGASLDLKAFRAIVDAAKGLV